MIILREAVRCDIAGEVRRARNATIDWEQLGFYWSIGNDAAGQEATRLLATLHALRQGPARHG